jgi:T-complex protein 1 subunit theta
MGYCNSVKVEEIGSKTVTIFQHSAESKKHSKLVSIILRASTMSVLNDLERAVDDGVQAIAQASQKSSNEYSGQYVYGGGAFEMSLSTKLQNYANSIPGLEQYAIAAFGRALEVIPRTLAENAGWDSTRILADMQAAHASTASNTICDIGVDIDGLLNQAALAPSTSAAATSNNKNVGTASMNDKQVYDLLSTKMSALRLAVDATITILKIDQIIMSKPSGGPGAPPKSDMQ